jgi:hypothetical protein
MSAMFRFREPKIVVISKALPRDSEWRALHGIADRARPEMIEAFLKAVARTQGAIVLKDVEQAMAMGELNAAVNAIPWATFVLELGQLGLIFQDVYQKAGEKSISYLPKTLQTKVNFTMLNPKSLEFIKEHTGKLIVEITEETRQAVKEIINRAFIEGMHPYESARYIRRIVGLTVRQSLAVDNLRKSLTDKGISAKLIKKQTESYAKRLHIYRSQNISRTETITAANRGQQGMWDQTADQGLINRATTKRKWITTPDDRLCEWCASLNGKLVALDEEFTTPMLANRTYTALTPTLHPSCRCALGLVFD